MADFSVSDGNLLKLAPKDDSAGEGLVQKLDYRILSAAQLALPAVIEAGSHKVPVSGLAGQGFGTQMIDPQQAARMALAYGEELVRQWCAPANRGDAS